MWGWGTRWGKERWEDTCEEYMRWRREDVQEAKIEAKMRIGPVSAYGCRPCYAYARPLLPLQLRRHPHPNHRNLFFFPPHPSFPIMPALSYFFPLLPNPNHSLFSAMQQLWPGSGSIRNKAMVEDLQRCVIITSNKVAQVMEAIDRGFFVPEEMLPYADSPMPIGHNATISAPHMHAYCLQLLEQNLQPGMRVLDVGSGSGYLTACFALMVGPEGRAVGVEHIPELVSSSIENIQKSAAAPLLKDGSLAVYCGDGRQGWAECGPYDAIHVGAAAEEIPEALMEQLNAGGRMVIPVGNMFQDLQVVDKNSDGSLSIRTETSVRYVPLTSPDAQLRGY